MSEQKPSSFLRRTAFEIKKYRVMKKTIPIIITACAILLIIGYILSALYMKFGAFTVMIRKSDSDYLLTLSSNANFNTVTSRLNAQIDEKITNIDGRSLPLDLNNVDGVHNGKNYIAYTFYCKNAGQNTVDYSYHLYIANMTLDIEKACRIRLYVDGEYVDYAYPRTDGVEGPEPGTTAFLSTTTVVKKTIEDFKPGDITKYTVIIWLEGNDPECVDRILGGQMKVDMEMSIEANKGKPDYSDTQTD